MCETAVISDRIVKIGTRSFRENIESIGRNYISSNKLALLNKDLDNLYELIYDQFPTITPEDYLIFGGQLKQLIKTIKELYNTCKRAPISLGIKEETEILCRNYSALYELNNDIKNFKVKTSRDSELHNLLKQASASLNALSI